MTHVYHLDVDLLGGLHALASQAGPHFIETDGVQTGEGSDAHAILQELRDRLLYEAKSFLALEIDVASRKAAALEGLKDANNEDARTAFEIDVARGAREQVANHQSRLAELERTADRVLSVFRLADKSRSKEGADGIRVHLHWDGYAMEATREAQLSARREHLGLPADADWHQNPLGDVA